MRPLLLLAFVILFCNTYAQTSPSELTVYKKNNTVVRYPANWTIDTSAAMGAGAAWVIFSPLQDMNDKFRENVNLVVEDLTGKNIDLDKFVDLSITQIKQLMTDGKLYESARIQSDNGEYQQMIFSTTQGEYKLKFEQYYFIKNEKAFILTFTAEQTQFETFRPYGEQILNSFTFTK